MSQSEASRIQDLLVLGKYRPGESVGCGRVDQIEAPGVVGVLVDKDGEHWSEDLLSEELVVRILALEQSWIHVVAARLVVLASVHQLALLIVYAVVDVADDAVEGFLVDDGRRERAEVERRVDLELGHQGDQALLELWPLGLGHVETRAGRALLTAVLVGRADCGNGYALTKFKTSKFQKSTL